MLFLCAIKKMDEATQIAINHNHSGHRIILRKNRNHKPAQSFCPTQACCRAVFRDNSEKAQEIIQGDV